MMGTMARMKPESERNPRIKAHQTGRLLSLAFGVSVSAANGRSHWGRLFWILPLKRWDKNTTRDKIEEAKTIASMRESKGASF
jgi:hypothetical protein